MLPPGHIAAGFLTAQALLAFTDHSFSSVQMAQLSFIGAFFRFAPDLDCFYSFFRLKRFTITDDDPSHRKYYSHAPMLWLITGLVIWFFASDPFLKYTGLLVWLGSWSHFLLDTIQHGVMWAWPFTSNIFAIKDRGMKFHIAETKFFPFWFQFVKLYMTKAALSFYIEIAIILVALFIAYSSPVFTLLSNKF